MKELINRTQFFKVYTLIDHSNDIKMFKTQVEPRAVHFEHFDVISTVNKNIDNGKMRSILVFTITLTLDHVHVCSNVIGDELLLNFNAKFQCSLIISHVKLQNCRGNLLYVSVPRWRRSFKML